MESFFDILSCSISRLYKPDHNRFKAVSEDPDDDVVLTAAYTGNADIIVPGDRHILGLGQFKKTRIVNVTQMLELLAQKN